MSDENVVDFFDAKMKIKGLQFSFIPSSQGYPAYRDPAADHPQGRFSDNMGAGEERYWKNHYAPNEHKR